MALCAFIALGGCSKRSPDAAKTDPQTPDNQLNITQYGTDVRFAIQSLFKEDYLVFEMQPDSKNYYDGYLVGIPLETALSLKKEYSDIVFYKSRNNEAVRSSLHDIQLIGYTPAFKTAMQPVTARNDFIKKTNGERICVRLQGKRLSYIYGTRRGSQMPHPDPAHGELLFIQPASIALIPCQ